MALTPAALLAFVSTALMARSRMGGGEPTPEVIEVPPEPKPEPSEPAPEVKEPEEEAEEAEPEPEEDETAALKGEVIARRAYQKALLETLARERDERITLMTQLAHAQMRLAHLETLYMGSEAQQSNRQLQAQAMQNPHRIRDPGHRAWGICTCVPGRADAFRRQPAPQFGSVPD